MHHFKNFHTQRKKKISVPRLGRSEHDPSSFYVAPMFVKGLRELDQMYPSILEDKVLNKSKPPIIYPTSSLAISHPKFYVEEASYSNQA